ncbi:unnamed protein product [Cuscuta epithymum]|uniref:Exonuclease domain-containing protein n=1 Tax=Cuscuta epithymum TaxID=186058 RepID=A0AAV0GGU4_9ASTE|nr:unnamed protein product [Cuscuta epithymum]
MDEMIASAKKNVLVDVVKLSQKRKMKGSKGDWKEFLEFYDNKNGSNVSDPAKRSADDLAAFLKTFSEDEDMKIFSKVFECHSNRDALVEFQKLSSNSESPEQRLVRLTLENPQYTFDYALPSHKEGWLVIKRSKKTKALHSTKMLAIDCEMALCNDGTEALIRVCAVNQNLKVKLNELVKPSKVIADYRTDITGITASDLDGVTCSLTDVQKSLKKLLCHGKILVGHSLCNDLRALQIDHARVIDTSYIFKCGDVPSNRRPSLSNLCKFVLGYELRKKGSPHNCLDDAITAMKLVKEKIEHDVIDSIPEEAQEDANTKKLLVHRIPVGVPCTDLHQIISGEFTVEMRTHKTTQDKYSALAIFKNQKEANEAFEKLEGSVEKDPYGRSQKIISFLHNTGVFGRVCVCKLAREIAGKDNENTTIKRPLQDEEPSRKCKKLKKDHHTGSEELEKKDSDQCETHLMEIERLKGELRQRDKEITSLNKIVIALTRKHGL